MCYKVGVEGHEDAIKLQKKQNESLGKLYGKYFYNMVSAFCLYEVSMDRYQIWSLLSSETFVGVKLRDTSS